MENCLIETRGSTRRFGKRVAVNDLNLSVPAGRGLIAGSSPICGSIGREEQVSTPLSAYDKHREIDLRCLVVQADGNRRL